MTQRSDGAGGRVNAVIADDEPLLRAQLRAKLARLWPELAIVHEMENGRDVEQVLAKHAPALFFLDIHMPGVNGLEAARVIGPRARVVFVTAYDEYAVEAFERGAIDYVLKPFDESRLELTVDRLKERLAAAQPPQLEQLVESLAERLAPRASQHLRWIKASVGPNVRLIPVEEVLFSSPTRSTPAWSPPRPSPSSGSPSASCWPSSIRKSSGRSTAPPS